MNKPGLILIMCAICCLANSQQEVKEEDKIFNFGATIGLKSVLPVVSSLTIDDIEADNIQVTYRVGYQASIFCRINVDRLFLQPSFSWHHASGEISFSLPSEDNDLAPGGQNRLKTKYESLEMPVLVGYKLVKEGPYGLSLMVGPKIKYNYNTNYDFRISGSQNRFSKESNLFDISIVTGVGVSIWRLFFDFSYEFGLNRIDSDFKNQNPNEPLINTMAINQHVNVMSFSLGLLF